MTKCVLDAVVCFAVLLKTSNRVSSSIGAVLGFNQSVPVQTLVTVCHLSISKLDYAFEEIQETSSIAACCI